MKNIRNKIIVSIYISSSVHNSYVVVVAKKGRFTIKENSIINMTHDGNYEQIPASHPEKV